MKTIRGKIHFTGVNLGNLFAVHVEKTCIFLAFLLVDKATPRLVHSPTVFIDDVLTLLKFVMSMSSVMSYS